MSRITTHVLDTARGRPAAGVPVRLDGPAGPDGLDGRTVRRPGGGGPSSERGSPTTTGE